jgi:hypothetical protein
MSQMMKMAPITVAKVTMVCPESYVVSSTFLALPYVYAIRV